MTARTTYVPLHTIIVDRDGKQVDTLAEYNRTGKAFKFTAEEIKQIEEAFDGDVTKALRNPAEEGAIDEDDNSTTTGPATSNAPAPGVTPENTPPAAKAKTAGKAKDADL